MSNATIKISIKRIDSSLSLLHDINDATKELMTGYAFMKQVSDDLDREDTFSKEVMHSVEQMIITINRMNYAEEARLKHLKMTQQCENAAHKMLNAGKKAAEERRLAAADGKQPVQSAL